MENDLLNNNSNNDHKSENYLENVSLMIDNQLEISINEELKRDILKVIAQRKIKSINEDSLDEACKKLFIKTKEKFNKNIEKLKIYSMRNIFIETPITNNNPNHILPSMLIIPKSNIIDEELTKLRDKTLSLHNEHQQLLNQCYYSDLLLKEMRSTLFTLRVGAQAFDDGDIQPIAETLANITQQQMKLHELCREGKDIIDKLDQYKIDSKDVSYTKEVEDIQGSNVEIGDLSDILLLNKNILGDK